MIEVTCVGCGEKFKDYPSNRRKFCSPGCVTKPKKYGVNTRADRIYTIWSDMKSRCSAGSKTGAGYYDHASVCDEWKSDFEAFRSWALANGYADDLTIDRVDGSKGYSPGNCRWATKSQQAANRRSSGNGIAPKTSQYRGVRKLPSGRWRAQVSKKGRPIHVGVFSSEIDAAKARDEAAVQEYGADFAILNFPRKEG